MWVWLMADNRWTQADYICRVSLWLFFFFFFWWNKNVSFFFVPAWLCSIFFLSLSRVFSHEMEERCLMRREVVGLPAEASKVCEERETGPTRPRCDVTVTTVTRHPGQKRCQARQVCEGAACAVTIPSRLPHPPPSLKCHHPSLPPSSASLITLCHFPQSWLPSVLWEILPICFSHPLFFSVFWLAGCCRGGFSNSFMSRTPRISPH